MVAIQSTERKVVKIQSEQVNEMSPRLNYWQVAPEAAKRVRHVNEYLSQSSIDPLLRHLIWLRISQINGCSYCVDLHTHEAMRDGEKQQRLDCLVVWRETAFYSDKEKAALEWAEALTDVSRTHAPDQTYDVVRKHFDDKDLVDLTLLISTMNAWNRMAIGFRRGPATRT